jgi:hypothetical protein
LFLYRRLSKPANKIEHQNNSAPTASILISAEDAYAAEPAIAASRNGAVYVAWVEHQAEGAANVRVARLNPNGERIGASVRVNPNDGEATAWRGDPPTLVVASDNTLYVGWTRRIALKNAPNTHASDLCLSASHDDGQTFDAPVKVNDNPQPAMHGMHSLAVSEDKRIYLAWLDERNSSPVAAYHEKENSRDAQSNVKFLKAHVGENHASAEHKMEGNREVFTAFSVDGGRTFSVNRRIAKDVCPCCKTALAVASSIDEGQSFSPPVIVSDDRWMIEGCPVSGAALNVAADNRLRVVWYTAGAAGAHGLYYAESNDGGQSFTARRSLIAGEMRGTPAFVSGANNTLFVVWEANDASNGASYAAMKQVETNGHAGDLVKVANEGELPAAAETMNNQIFVAYVAKENNKHSIHLTRLKL